MCLSFLFLSFFFLLFSSSPLLRFLSYNPSLFSIYTFKLSVVETVVSYTRV